MPITFACDCGHEIAAPDGQAGQRWLCPWCIELVRVPQPPAAEPELLAPAPERRGAGTDRLRGGLLMVTSGLPVGLGAILLELPAAGLLAVLLIGYGVLCAARVLG